MDRESATYVVAGEVVNRGLGQHAVVLQLGLAERRSVAGNDDQLGLAGAEALQGGLVAQSDPTRISERAPDCGRAQHSLSGLHDKREPRVDRVGCLLGLLGGHLCGICSGVKWEGWLGVG